MAETLLIGEREVGEGLPCFVIAEAGVNHNGDIEIAKELVDAAHAAGADAVKFQTWTTEALITREAPKAGYQLATTGGSQSQYEMLEGLRLPYDAFDHLRRRANAVGICFLSTPYDLSDLDFLTGIGMPAVKVPSMDIVNLPMLASIAQRGLPVLLSTGMASLGEIEQGLEVLEKNGAPDVVLYHCVTGYPVPHEDANLRVIRTLHEAFRVPVGLSDHSNGIAVPIAAVALGAVSIEKHFTLDRKMVGPDHAASLDPSEFKAMVNGIREVEAAMGSPRKVVQPIELENRRTMRRSLVAARDLPVGTRVENEDLTLKRPGTGLPSSCASILVGHRLSRPLVANEQVSFDHFMDSMGDTP